MNMKVSGKVVRQLRLARGWTQEHLATLAETATKTIQRVEMGGKCTLETRSALAAVFQIDVQQLDGEEAIEQAQTEGDDGPLFFHRLRSGSEVVGVFQDSVWYRWNHEEPRNKDDVDLIADSIQLIHDWAEIWGDLDPGAKVKATFELTELLEDLALKGFWAFGLRTRSTFTFPVRDGNTGRVEGPVCNIHLAYADSDRIIVLDPRESDVPF